MKYLVNNLNNMCFSDDSKDLLKNSIIERLSDDSPLVIYEALKFETADLIKIIGHTIFVDKLQDILSKYRHDSKWQQPIASALEHITSKLTWNDSNVDNIFVSLLPFLFPLQPEEIELMQIVVRSNLAGKIDFIKSCRTNLTEINEIHSFVEAQLKKGKGLPKIESILSVIETIPEKKMTTSKAFLNIFLVSHILPKTCNNFTVAQKILSLIAKYTSQMKTEISTEQSLSLMVYAASNSKVYPIQINFICIKRLIECTNLAQHFETKPIDFSEQTDVLSLLLTIFEILVNGLWVNNQNEIQLYNNALAHFLKEVFPHVDKRIEFFSNFYISHLLMTSSSSSSSHKTTEQNQNQPIQISTTLQVQSCRLFNVILKQINNSKKIQLSINSFICILSGLASPTAAVRKCTYETIEILGQIESLKGTSCVAVIDKLLPRREELYLDCNQLPLIIYQIFSGSKSASKLLQNCLHEMFELIGTKDQKSLPSVHCASLLEMLKHLNSTEYIKMIIDSSFNILKNVTSKTNPPNCIQKLNIYESKIIKAMLFRFNSTTINVVKVSPICWEFIKKSIESHNLFLTTTSDGENEDIQSLAGFAMDIFDEALFSQLVKKHQTELIEIVIGLTAQTQSSEVLQSARKLMKRIRIDVKEHVNTFAEMKGIDILGTAVGSNSKANKRKSDKLTPKSTQLSTDILDTIQWKSGIAMLEYLQNKKNIVNSHCLIASLFDVLKRCLEFEEQSLVEYVKQLTLSCILHCCQLISPDGKAKRDLVPDKVFDINSVVQCIRGTQNPQTHHHALQLLIHTAAMIPELVLHNMIDIFTFVGSSIVRRDDAYTYQIISNIIKSIIPTLIQSNELKDLDAQHETVIPVLRVFADIVLDVPEHRRLRLYEDFLNTLDPTKYLWMFLAVLFESHVRNFGPSTKRGTNTADTKRINVAVEITNRFSCSCIVDTCTKLIEYLHQQPLEKPSKHTDDKMEIDITDTTIFNIRNYSDYQLRHFKYTTLQYIILLTARTSTFVQNIASIDVGSTYLMKPHFKNIILTVLQFVGKITKYTGQNDEKYWRVILSNSYDVLDQVLAVIYPDMLLQVVSGLLNRNNILEVRRKAIELLNKKLQVSDFFFNCNQETLLGLLGKLFLFFISF